MDRYDNLILLRPYAEIPRPVAQADMIDFPCSSSGQNGLNATSHTCPSRSAKYPEYPPHSISPGAFSTVPPAASISTNAASTAARSATLIAGVKPREPGWSF